MESEVRLMYSLLRRRRPARQATRPATDAPTERWSGLMPPAGPDARCLICKASRPTCACVCQCGNGRAACRCNEFLTAAAARARYDGNAAGRQRRVRVFMRKFLSDVAAAEAMLLAQVFARSSGTHCTICGGPTPNGHVGLCTRCAICGNPTTKGYNGLCNACRNQSSIRVILRDVRRLVA